MSPLLLISTLLLTNSIGMEEETILTCSSTEINVREDENELANIDDVIGENVEDKV